MSRAKITKIDSNWTHAVAHLRKDPKMARLIEQVGPCVLKPRADYFSSLCQSIISQQISTKAAASVFARFRALYPRRKPTPACVFACDEAQLRSVGLSGQKVRYIRGLSEAFGAGRIPTRRFRNMSNEEIIESLIALKGVGRWTAEMFLMFVLNRPDVWPVDDLGLRAGIKRIYDLATIPTPPQAEPFGEPWRPYRTVAAWYLWRAVAPPKPDATDLKIAGDATRIAKRSVVK